MQRITSGLEKSGARWNSRCVVWQATAELLLKEEHPKQQASRLGSSQPLYTHSPTHFTAAATSEVRCETWEQEEVGFGVSKCHDIEVTQLTSHLQPHSMHPMGSQTLPQPNPKQPGNARKDPPNHFEPALPFTFTRDMERGRYLGGYWLAGPAGSGCCWPPACSAGHGKHWVSCCWGSQRMEQGLWRRFLLLNSAYRASKRERRLWLAM